MITEETRELLDSFLPKAGNPELAVAEVLNNADARRTAEEDPLAKGIGRLLNSPLS